MESDSGEELELPDDLVAALEGAPAAKTLFDGLSPRYRNQWVAWIVEAPGEDTRAERLREAVRQLAAGDKQRH